MFLLSDSVSIDVSVSSSVVSSFSSRPCLLYLRPQRRSSLPVSLAEVFDESDPQFFADGGVLGHLPQRVPVYSLCELDDDQPGLVFLSSPRSMSRVHDVVDVRSPWRGDFYQQVSNHFSCIFPIIFFDPSDSEVPTARVPFHLQDSFH